jgi:multimeric flavodoxin WrbA
MPVYFSNVPGKLLKEIDEFSGFALKKRPDLQIIFEESLTKGKEKQLEELAFTSKYVKGLIRVLKDSGSNPEVKNSDNIKNDLSENMKKAVNQLKEIIAESDDNTRSYFSRAYFQLTPESFMNLNELLEDLEWTKKYLNNQKRGMKN